MTLNENEARNLIETIKHRASGLHGQYDYFLDSDAVCELVEATLIGVGYDREWVFGPFSDMLYEAVEQHRTTEI